MSNTSVLIVEDNDVLRDGLDDALTIEGYKVLTAEEGNAALQIMESSTPDLIISDIAMPVMNGYEFFAEVRKRPEWVTIPFIFLTARSEQRDILAGKGLGVEDYLTKPVSREELLTTIKSRLTRIQELQLAQLKQAYYASMTALAKAIDLRDPYTGGHVERVTEYALALGQELAWNKEDLEDLRFGAILHDIGKIHIPKSTLLKKGSLDEEQWIDMRRHPVIGAEMISGIPYLAGALPIIKHHHEHWDGKGYPDGLRGENIPHGARIVGVADSFDAMITVRPYSTEVSLSEAHEKLRRCAGKQFDPDVIKAFDCLWTKGVIEKISSQ
jgi:putative two-component system response regulator